MSLALLGTEKVVCFFIPGRPDTTCHAFVGETVILPCTATSPGELILSNSMLYWQIGSVVVHFSYNGQDSPDYQNQHYRGRTSLFWDQMKHGNFSLKLSNVQLQDTAVYNCIYKQTGDHPSKTQKSKINLIVSGKIFFLGGRERELRAAFLVDKPFGYLWVCTVLDPPCPRGMGEFISLFALGSVKEAGLVSPLAIGSKVQAIHPFR